MELQPKICATKSCGHHAYQDTAYCTQCLVERNHKKAQPMSKQYPKYYKSVKGLEEIDVYTVHQLFNIEDPSGCIQHASKKLLLSGVRTGGKSKIEDIKEARDTLTRFLQLHGAA